MFQIFKDKIFYKNFFYAGVTLILLFVLWLKYLDIYTNHNDYISVPDFKDVHITDLDSIFDLSSLSSDGLLVIEHEKKIQFSKHDMFYFDKKYGGTMLSFFKKASL